MSTLPQPIQYQGSNDPRKIAQNQRALVQQRGDELMNAQGVMQGQAEGQRNQYSDYLNQIERPLAQGQGGYNAQELSQIRMTPQQQQDIITGAGISAGANTAAGVGAAERAANAAGGNPAALAAYRARAAQQIGAQAGDAMTQARIGASNAAAQRAQNIGQTRIGQQQAALGQQQQQAEMYNTNAQNAANRALQAYGTQTGGTGTAAGLGLQASQTPTTFDKVMGGIAGFLDEGDVMGDDMTSAVVGENGPEKVVNLRRQNFQDGYVGAGGGMGEDVYNNPANAAPSPGNPGGTGSTQPQPFWKKLGNTLFGQQQQQSPQPNTAPTPGTGQWNPSDTYKSIGQAGRNVAQGLGLAKLFMADGGVAAPDSGRYRPANEVTPMARIDRYEEEMFRPRPGAPLERVLGSRRVVPDPEVDLQMGGPPPRLGANPLPPKAPPQADGGIAANKTFRAKPNPGAGIAPSAPQGQNGIFTKPTRVNLAKNEAVVPLSYRATAKTRPSMAALPAAPVTKAPGARPYHAPIRRPSIPAIGSRRV